MLTATRSLAIDEKILGVDHPETALQLENRAELLNSAGRFSEADGLGRRALAIWQREIGPEHPAVASALTIIGRSSLGMGNAREAITTLDRAYSIRQSLDPEPSRVAETGFLLAQAMWSKRASRQDAMTIALEAKKNYAEASNSQGVAEVTHWLASHDTY